MSAILENLNDQQFDAMKQFRKNVNDVLPPDYPDFWIWRWLKAHNFNLEKTESLFRSGRNCTEIYLPNVHPDKYVKPEVFQKYEFSCTIGHAKDGTLIRYTSFGTGDLLVFGCFFPLLPVSSTVLDATSFFQKKPNPGFLMSVSGYDVSFYCTYLLHYDQALMKKYTEETGKDVYEVTYIVDLEGFSVGQVLHKSIVETALDLLQAMQDFYPEVFGNIFIVNAPSYFDVVFNVIKPILRLNMLERIRMASKESTPAMLLKYIDEDVLPQFLGGKRTDSSGDPRCSEFLKFGGKIPEEYYSSNKKTLLMPTDPDVTSKWISARSVYNHSVVVRKPHSKIHVELRSENGGIGFKMQFRGFGDNPDDVDLPPSDVYLDENKPSHNVKYVSPTIRHQSHWSPVDVIVTVPWPGIYIFRFDNTYGWFTSRRIIFRIRVEDD